MKAGPAARSVAGRRSEPASPAERSGGLSFAAWRRRCVGHDESTSLLLLLARQQMPNPSRPPPVPVRTLAAASGGLASTKLSLVPPPWRGIDDQRALAQRHTRQAARHDLDALGAGQHERPEIDMARRRAPDPPASARSTAPASAARYSDAARRSARRGTSRSPPWSRSARPACRSRPTRRPASPPTRSRWSST